MNRSHQDSSSKRIQGRMQVGHEPLLDIAMNYTQDISVHLSEEEKTFIRDIFRKYISEQIPYQTCAAVLKQKTGSCAPAERIREILEVPHEPLPSKEFVEDDGLRKKTQQWNKIEDIRLIAAIHRYGSDNWSMVSAFVGNNRSRSQCSQRWFRGLDPRISRQHWSNDEEKRLLSLIEIYGVKSWIKVASELGNRSDVQCRYHYLQMKRENKKEFQKIEMSQSPFLDRKDKEISQQKIHSVNQMSAQNQSEHKLLKDPSHPLQTPAPSPHSADDVSLSITQQTPDFISQGQKSQEFSQPTFMPNVNSVNNMIKPEITQNRTPNPPPDKTLPVQKNDFTLDFQESLPLNFSYLFENNENSMLYDSLWPAEDFY